MQQGMGDKDIGSKVLTKYTYTPYLKNNCCWCMCYPVWMHCSKQPNYDFCLSQGSAVTVLMLDRQSYSRLHQVSSW